MNNWIYGWSDKSLMHSTFVIKQIRSTVDSFSKREIRNTTRVQNRTSKSEVNCQNTSIRQESGSANATSAMISFTSGNERVFILYCWANFYLLKKNLGWREGQRGWRGGGRVYKGDISPSLNSSTCYFIGCKWQGHRHVSILVRYIIIICAAIL